MTARRTALAVLVGAAALAGCSVSTPGTPTGQAPSPSASAPVTAAPGTCRLEAGSGSVSMRGGSGRVTTRNGVTTFTCGSGPAVTIASVGPDGVGLALDGAPAVPVRPGEAADIGPYRITVDAVTGAKATLQVVPPS